MSGLRVRRHLWVSGRVQNVWFREGCAHEARGAGVDGWVHNLADGRVEAVLEGDAEAVARVIAWCHEGPTRARVTEVEVRVELPLDGRSTSEMGFRVR